jgi:signal transduction histidine kinase
MQDFIRHDAAASPRALRDDPGEADLRAASSQLRQMALVLDEHVLASAGERERTDLALRQEQRLSALGALTSGVAHDFNNLLHVLNGSLDRLGSAVTGNAPAERQIAHALAASRRCGQLAGQLLAFGRRTDCAPAPLDLVEALDEISQLLRQAAGEGVEIRIEADPTLWRAQADRAQFENAILNLTINARDAMDGSGVVILRLTNAPASAAVPEQIRLEVIDTGCGMSPDTALRAVEPFFSTKPSGKGAGLGLAMVERFARAAGGQVRIHSAPGRGTKVEIELPRAASQEREARTAPLTVLLAKTDDAERARLTAGLAALGYRIIEADTTRKALNIVESGAALDLLVADLVMPGRVCTPSLVRRARDRWPDLGVVFTAPRPAPFDANPMAGPSMLLLAGVDVLRGPCSPDGLHQKLRDVRIEALRPRASVILGAAPAAACGQAATS